MSEQKYKCSRCGATCQDYYNNDPVCNQNDPHGHDWQSIEDPAELSLLVIDMGDSCVVKVEKGMIDTVMQGGEVLILGAFRVKSGPIVVDKPFLDIRSAIDAMEKPPVPRIERDGEDDYRLFQRTWGDAERENGVLIRLEMFNDLCEIADTRIPIWSGGASGEWMPIIHEGRITTTNHGQFLSINNVPSLPVAIWRYVRRAK